MCATAKSFPVEVKAISLDDPVGNVAGFAYLAPKPVFASQGYAVTKGVVLWQTTISVFFCAACRFQHPRKHYAFPTRAPYTVEATFQSTIAV